MRAQLIRVLLWGLAKLGWTPEQGRVPDEVFRAAGRLVREQARREASGESKHHQVYARLIKDFPDQPHRVLGLAIELALWRE
jgi:hypothetical protein